MPLSSMKKQADRHGLWCLLPKRARAVYLDIVVVERLSSDVGKQSWGVRIQAAGASLSGLDNCCQSTNILDKLAGVCGYVRTMPSVLDAKCSPIAVDEFNSNMPASVGVRKPMGENKGMCAFQVTAHCFPF
ncbi:hypothetical protein BASA62_004613 [Batrachochytrium salamandrivorans]|nr:hypothetical protein BASA62_004613 [Batrachochytrium salamandrivorans]